jgi:NADPH-dependent 2,4-dienoyl-CoA reductase/sulfur reductase-like enzyme
MNTTAQDRASVAGKALAVAENTSLLVIGAGPAGLAAAIEAARRGIAVTLVDENPIPFETMGEDIPLHFGQRMGGIVRNRTAMTEEVLEQAPDIAVAFEAGVDVRLGTVAWGLYVPQPTAAWMRGPVCGLADPERSWLIGFDHCIVAAGRRDMGLAFPGWERPGVMGATAAQRLASHGALDARTAVILGSSAEALLAASALLDAGIDVATIVERAGTVAGPADLAEVLTSAGVPILTGHVVASADGGLDGVEAVRIVAVDAEGRHLAGTERTIACDTVVLGIAAIPAIELLEAAGCRVGFDGDRGGHVPLTGEGYRCSLPVIQAIGDCAGVWPSKSMNPEIARTEALIAIGAIAGSPASELPSLPAPDSSAADIAALRCGWVRASVVEAEGEPHVCQCEEVTAREILEVKPPRYLNWTAPANRPTDLAALLGEGPPSADQIKRLTRAGMGPCQGRRCREQVAALLALGSGVPLETMPLATFRAPVRPLPLSLLAESAEDPEITAHWDSWFGMAAQWVPYWRVQPGYTASSRDLHSPVASE